ncbi:hypothetical protein M0R72_07390 [Candidatus Pacearchaeota archaeon]|nr:hypothetical protein [Candidatus Pacearchaeota archaeon]
MKDDKAELVGLFNELEGLTIYMALDVSTAKRSGVVKQLREVVERLAVVSRSHDARLEAALSGLYSDIERPILSESKKGLDDSINCSKVQNRLHKLRQRFWLYRTDLP